MRLPCPSGLILNRLLLAIGGVFGIVLTAQTAPTEIHNEPLANPASSTKPNIMFVLDDSGSMGWDFSPDYMGDDDTNEDSPRVCFDHKDDNDTLTAWSTATTVTATGASLKQCRVGDVPYMAPQFNKQYYNPAIYYRPAVNYDGTEMPSQNAANTANWTSVRTDMFNKQNRDQLGNSLNYVNLVSGYPDRVWCTSKADDKTNPALCKKNQDYAYPSDTYGYGKDASGNIKYVTGAPYYYLATATEYCTTPDLITCNTQATPDATYSYEAVNRWCTNSGFTDCNGKRVGSYVYPKAFGRVHGTPAAPAASATATITVPAGADNVSMNITSIVINGVSMLNPTASYGPTNNVTLSGGVITATDGTDSSAERNSVAEAIRIGLNGRTDGTYTYAAARTNNVVTLTATPAGSGPNGLGITINSTITGVTAATATLTVSGVSAGSSITGLTVNGVSIISGTVNCNYSDSTFNRRACAQNIVEAINSHVSSPDYTATRSSNVVTITAPASLGDSANGWLVIETGSVATNSPRTMGGGVSSGVLPTTATPFTGGAEAQAAVTPTRSLVTPFARINILPGLTFTRYPNRSDCVSTPGVCTYAEEMTNFANWYAYYRTRMQMMKSASGRAFVPLGDNYRVGFITINPGSSVSSNKYLRIADFTDGSNGQRDNWYAKFYSQTPSGGTPLRQALSRVGWIYAGQLGSGLTSGLQAATAGDQKDDPVLYSCQPNFTILSSDGYWNGSGGQDLSGNTMGNEDGDDSGYSKQSDGAYDANDASNTLADVAIYYYKNDLRSTLDNNVPTSTRDTAQHQHMTTFTLGLGLDGYLSYRRDYDDPNLTTGDFYAIKQGTKVWPTPAADSPSALDDLWHAAVNGRGKFFSASNPEDLASGLSDTLAALQARVGAGAAAATSNLQPVAGDNFAFTAQYETVNWVGDLKARTIDLNTGIVSSVALWSAQNLLDNKLYTSRNIYLFDPADTLPAGNQLRHFCWISGGAGCTDGGGLSAAERSYFNPTLLLQYSSWTPAQQAAATGENLVNYLRGDTSLENTGASPSLVSDLYRNRTHILGDVVSAQPAYVRVSSFSYADNGYADFRTCTSGLPTGSTLTCPGTQFPTPSQPRRGTVYVAANDGMLHAFETDANNNPYYQTTGISTVETTDDTFTGNNAGNGEERWAYIPSMLLPNLRKLAEDPYTHRFFADGSPVVGDICASVPCAGLNDWRTILVAGLNAGGRGYYALDVTNPLSPKGLWEFAGGSGTACLTDAEANSGLYGSDCNLGYTYGNPVITKRKSDDKWVVIVTSGYNNFNPGDGKGYLYILDALTGKILQRFTTGVGDGGSAAASYADADPSGLAKINGWVENGIVNNTTLAIYGGDLKGNLWKFDLDTDSPGYNTVTKLATALSSGGTAQPITVKPELGAVGNKRVVIFGTGRFLGTTDKTNTDSHSIYAIRDDGSSSNIGRALLVQQTMQASTGDTRTVTSSNSVDWSTGNGWYIDLPDSGERVNVDPQLQLGTLVVASNVPSSDACTAGGYSWLNFLDFKTGRVIDNTPARKIASSLIVGLNVVVLPGGKVVTIVTTAENQQRTEETPVSPTSFEGRRVLWRELIVDQ